LIQPSESSGIENVDDKGRVDQGQGHLLVATKYHVRRIGFGTRHPARQLHQPSGVATAPLDKRPHPILPQDFVDVRPEAIFLGHGHGDHADTPLCAK